MTSQAVSRRYARALMAVAAKALNEIDERLSQIVEALTSEPGKRLFLNPTLSQRDKRDLVSAILDPDEGVVHNFLAVVIQHGRETELREISRQFHLLVLKAQGYTEATVETAQALTREQQESATAALDRFFGGRSWPNFQVVPALIGGVRVRFDDRMIDASVSGELGMIRKLLIRANQSEVTR